MLNSERGMTRKVLRDDGDTKQSHESENLPSHTTQPTRDEEHTLHTDSLKQNKLKVKDKQKGKDRKETD